MEKLTLNFLGIDSWSRPVYKDENGKLFKDINCDNGIIGLCTCGSFDGEPDTPIEYIKRYEGLEIEIIGREEEPTKEQKFNYQMLSRLQSDCKYYLGNGNCNKGNLWAGEEQKHIDEMKRLHNSFAEDKKPEWLTYEQILEYEKSMVNGKLYCPNCEKLITPDHTEYEEGLEGFKSGRICPECEEYIY